MRTLIIVLTVFLIGCSTSDKQNDFFKDVIGKEDILITLNTYGLDSVPREIGQLKNTKSLTILMDSAKRGWTIYPPLFATDPRLDNPPFKTLPNEITELKNLERLIIVDLNLSNLPSDFYKLENLEYLDLSMNKLTISKEIEKLKRLKKLKYLGLFGNRVDTIDIKKLKEEIPDIQINGVIE
jgi:hypothetical protein